MLSTSYDKKPLRSSSDHISHDQSLANPLADVTQFVILARKFIAMGEFLARKLFLRKTISNKIFHSDYKHITDRLPESLVKRACQRLLHHSKDPVPLESIFEKSE